MVGIIHSALTDTSMRWQTLIGCVILVIAVMTTFSAIGAYEKSVGTLAYGGVPALAVLPTFMFLTALVFFTWGQLRRRRVIPSSQPRSPKNGLRGS
jgi:hypothetical protein